VCVGSSRSHSGLSSKATSERSDRAENESADRAPIVRLAALLRHSVGPITLPLIASAKDARPMRNGAVFLNYRLVNKLPF
jgi:hypothetical protein